MLKKSSTIEVWRYAQYYHLHTVSYNPTLMIFHSLICYFFLVRFLFRFSAKGAESTTRPRRWSEALRDERSRFRLKLKLWPAATCRVQAEHHPDHSDLFSTTFIFHCGYCVAFTTAVKTVISVYFFNEKHCTKRVMGFFKIMKCFQVKLVVCDFILFEIQCQECW